MLFFPVARKRESQDFDAGEVENKRRLSNVLKGEKESSARELVDDNLWGLDPSGSTGRLNSRGGGARSR
jgi:hypothetical protein